MLSGCLANNGGDPNLCVEMCWNCLHKCSGWLPWGHALEIWAFSSTGHRSQTAGKCWGSWASDGHAFVEAFRIKVLYAGGCGWKAIIYIVYMKWNLHQNQKNIWDPGHASLPHWGSSSCGASPALSEFHPISTKTRELETAWSITKHPWYNNVETCIYKTLRDEALKKNVPM